MLSLSRELDAIAGLRGDLIGALKYLFGRHPASASNPGASADASAFGEFHSAHSASTTASSAGSISVTGCGDGAGTKGLGLGHGRDYRRGLFHAEDLKQQSALVLAGAVPPGFRQRFLFGDAPFLDIAEGVAYIAVQSGVVLVLELPFPVAPARLHAARPPTSRRARAGPG